ncbi:MAG TPA: hypothetical protein PJ982_09025 [Lacipirellulaceae bacterium]|nr:hypothetical protein [Lacipirellulaceae bacterium]
MIDVQERKVSFINISLDPHCCEVGYLKEHRPRLDRGSFYDVLLNDLARLRRANDKPNGALGLRERFVNSLVVNAEKLEPLAGAGKQVLASIFSGKQELLNAAVEVRAIDFRERLARFNLRECFVDEEFLQVAANPRDDFRQLAFIVLNIANCSDLLTERHITDWRRFHSRELNALGRKLDAR